MKHLSILSFGISLPFLTSVELGGSYTWTKPLPSLLCTFTLCHHHRGFERISSSFDWSEWFSKSLLLLLTPVISLLCFPDEPRVTLSGKCGGEVQINKSAVCSSSWNLEYSHLVCQEQQDCSKAVFNSSTSRVSTPLQHVACEAHHDRLGQCSRYEGLCAEGPVSVYCVGTLINLPVSWWVQIFLPPVLLCATILKLHCIVFQEASSSEPQDNAVDRSKSIIEISGKRFTSKNSLHSLWKSCVKSLVVKAIMVTPRYLSGMIW